jgi:hypothetical protein
VAQGEGPEFKHQYRKKILSGYAQSRMNGTEERISELEDLTIEFI